MKIVMQSISLTKSKTISMICWGIIAFMQLVALSYPTLKLPFALRAIIVAILVVCLVLIFYFMFSRKVEKPDERSIYNSYRANSAILQAIYIFIGFFILITGNMDIEYINVSRQLIVLVFSFICFLENAIFVCYERFSG